jgi:hypothetical protein
MRNGIKVLSTGKDAEQRKAAVERGKMLVQQANRDYIEKTYAPSHPFGNLFKRSNALILSSDSGYLPSPAIEEVLLWESRTSSLLSRRPKSPVYCSSTRSALGHFDGSIRPWRNDALVYVWNCHKTLALASSEDDEMLASGRGHKDVVTEIVWLVEGHVATSFWD